MRANARPILAAMRRRLYSSQAAARAEEGISKQGPKVTSLPSGAVVASEENLSPISRVAVLYKAGSRCEAPGNAGVSHILRLASSLSTKNTSQFALTRALQQSGASLTCTTSRENLTYEIECTRNNLDVVLPLLQDAATCPAFHPWEVADVQQRLTLDLALLAENPAQGMMEHLHKAAFRDTLGQSLFCPEHMVGHYSNDMLAAHVNANLASNRMVVVGTGVDHDDLVKYASQLTAPTATAEAIKAAKYYGGEARVSTLSPLVYAAVVTEGAALGTRDSLVLGVLQNIMGTGPSVKYGSGAAGSRLIQAAGGATSQPFALSGVNVNYTDSGLFGFSVVAQASESGKVLKAAASQMTSLAKGNIDDQEVTRAKNQLKAAISMLSESSSDLLEDLGLQASSQGGVVSAEQLCQTIDGISGADVLTVAKKVMSGKPSMAALGDLSSTPYLDELF